MVRTGKRRIGDESSGCECGHRVTTHVVLHGRLVCVAAGCHCGGGRSAALRGFHLPPLHRGSGAAHHHLLMRRSAEANGKRS